MIKLVLLGLLGAIALVFVAAWLRELPRRRASGDRLQPTPLETVVGFVTNFFDTLGVGSFAPTTSVYRIRRIVPDELIPGTLNVGHAPPVILQAFIFITLVAVETRTLVVLIAAAVLGAWLGAGVATKLPRRAIQLTMGTGLLIAGTVAVLNNLDELRGSPLIPGGQATGLSDTLLIVAAAINFVLGALVTMGIGLYAPCLIMISLMGMNPVTAFPIMMGACAFLMPVASLRFIRAGRYSAGPALGLALGGLPAVLIAGLIVKTLPLTVVRWLVAAVVIYTAISLLRSAAAAGRATAAANARV